MTGEILPPIAAVVHDKPDRVDTLMVSVAARLRAHGWRLGGLVQHNVYSGANVCSAMLLEELVSGRRVSISLLQPTAAGGCRLDATGLAEAAMLASSALPREVDLVIFNKFGRQEAEGRGLRDEFILAVASGLPVLTSVNVRFLDAWRAFVGDAWSKLAPDEGQISSWCQSLKPPAHGLTMGSVPWEGAAERPR